MTDLYLLEPYVIDPASRLPFSQDWSPWLANYGNDTIGSVVVAVEAGSAEIENITNDTTSVTYYVKNAVVGDLLVSVTVTTSAGKIDKRTDVFRVAEQ
jgi:hypothetical protein